MNPSQGSQDMTTFMGSKSLDSNHVEDIQGLWAGRAALSTQIPGQIRINASSATREAGKGGRGEHVSFAQGDGHDRIGIGRRIHPRFEGGIGGHLGEKGVELGFRHGTSDV